MGYILDKKIEYFITVVEEGSFSAAARKLYMSQPAISQFMETLEKDLGIDLFDRKSYRALPTAAGKELYQKCVKIKKETDAIEKELRINEKKIIHIGFTPSHSYKRFIKLINTLQKRYPSLAFDLTEGSFKENTIKLNNGELDLVFGIKCEFEATAGLEYESLYSYDLVVISSYDNPLKNRLFLTPEDIKNQNFILLSPSYSEANYREMMEAFKKDGILPQIVKEVDSFDELIYSIAADQGIGIVSTDVVSKEDVCPIPLNNSHHNSTFAVGYRSNPDNVINDILNDVIEYYRTS